MGGIGVSINGLPDTELTSLPNNVLNEIAAALKISQIGRDSLAKGKIDLPENVEVEITRKTNGDSCTLTKLPGGAGYRLKYKDKTIDIPPI
jgi:hypothetical protein